MSNADSTFALSTRKELFVTPIWVFDVEQAQIMNVRLRASLENLMAPLPDIPAGATWQSEQRLHHAPEFSELMDVVHEAVAQALAELEVESTPIEITGAWANINPRGSAHHAHTHPNNYLSGVYYLKVPAGSGVISFQDPRPQTMQINPRVARGNPLNSTTQSVSIEEGRLVLFPAWLAHNVPPNPADDVRISVSFNLMFSDFTEKMCAPIWSGLPLKGVS